MGEYIGIRYLPVSLGLAQELERNIDKPTAGAQGKTIVGRKRKRAAVDWFIIIILVGSPCLVGIVLLS